MSQLKIKDGNNWIDIPSGGIGVPSGGTTGQVLVKSSNTDYATEWATASEWEDVTSAFTPVTGVTNFTAFYNAKRNVIWLSGWSPTPYTAGNTLVTIPSVYAGEGRIHAIHYFFGGDGTINYLIVNGTNMYIRNASGSIQFTTSFNFYGEYHIA